MTQKSKPTRAEVEKLLDQVMDRLDHEPSYMHHAYNYLVDYTEGLLLETLEGDRLVKLSFEMLKHHLESERAR